MIDTGAVNAAAFAAITAMLTDDNVGTLTAIAMLDGLTREEVECVVFAVARTAASGIKGIANERDVDPVALWQHALAIDAATR